MYNKNKIGFIGAGNMAYALIKGLLSDGFDKNRRPIDELVALGANEVLSLADMASCCNSFILCLPSSACDVSL